MNDELNVSALLLQSFFHGVPLYLSVLKPLVLAVFVVLLYKFVLKKGVQYFRWQKHDLDQIDHMSGQEFEEFLHSLFLKLGYIVQHTGKFGDDGGDLVLEKNSIRTVVQAKRSTYPVRKHAIQEVVTAKAVYNCSKAMVVTNNYYYQGAWNLGKRNDVILWSRKELAEAISQVSNNLQKK